MKIIKLANHPEILDQAAAWFSDKWGSPAEVYRDSMQTSIEQPEIIPNGMWFLVI